MAASGILASGVLPTTTAIISRPKSALAGCWVGGGRGGGDNNKGMMSQGLTMIECSSRPQKKATAHHRKTRPRKSQPWDIRRGPAVYPPLPQLPPEWTLVESSSSQEPQQQEEVESSLATASSTSG